MPESEPSRRQCHPAPPGSRGTASAANVVESAQSSFPDGEQSQDRQTPDPHLSTESPPRKVRRQGLWWNALESEPNRAEFQRRQYRLAFDWRPVQYDANP